MKKIQLLLISLFCTAHAFAQITFQKTYTGVGGFFAVGQLTNDGSYLITGNTGSRGIYLIKTDQFGTLKWSNTYDAIDTGFRYPNSVAQSMDGYAICGNFGNSSKGNKTFILKIDTNGMSQWSKLYDDGANDIIATSDTGYAIVSDASSQSSIYVGKTDSMGNLKWAEIIGGANYAYRMVQNADGSFTIAGYTTSFGGGIYLVKTDAGGNIIWTKIFEGGGIAVDIKSTYDGGYILSGEINYNDVTLIKTDSAGNIKWAKAYRTAYGASLNQAVSSCQTLDSGFAVCCTTATVIKTDKNGALLWSKDYSGGGVSDARCISATSDGGLMILGDNYSAYRGFILTKTDLNGNTACPFPDVTIVDSVLTFTVGTGGSVVSAGSQLNETPVTSPLLITDSVICAVTAIPEEIDQGVNVLIYPNPATNQLTIHASSFHNNEAVTISIMNMLGQEASCPIRLHMIRGDASIDVSKLPAGIYFLQLKSESGSVVKKFVKE